MQFLELFDFGVRTRSASSYRARYVVFRRCSGAWAKDHRVEWHYIAPGRPMQNSVSREIVLARVIRACRETQQPRPGSPPGVPAANSQLYGRAWRAEGYLQGSLFAESEKPNRGS